MAWLSYSQNGEDVRLRRAFANQQSGFYIDVGANNPVEFSITKHFYDSGWSGINVEPAPAPFALVAADRQRDINLNVGCSNKAGSMVLYTGRGNLSALSTFTALEAEVHRKNGHKLEAVETPVETLSAICEQHASGRTIDFLSIDVEGHEREVLEGADFSRFRPRVVVIEATRPNTTVSTHERWEHLLLDNGYEFVVFDGLNRYYVRREDSALAPAIALSPNVFDDFTPYTYRREIEKLRAELLGYRAVGPVAKTVARAINKLGSLVRFR
ncbi:MAG TPA: FkbM family methyltransferase [Polyangiaceae bacterium]|nr:FkbM family methyltransferase [Polyangiaceae bacterium]